MPTSENLMNYEVEFNIKPQNQITKDDIHLAGNVFYQQISCNEPAPFSGEQTRVATFSLNSPNCAMDLFNSTIEGDIAIRVGTSGCLDGDIHSLFTQVRLLDDTGVLYEDCLRYNVKHIMEKVATVGNEYCKSHMEDWSDNINVAESAKIQITSTPRAFEFIPDLSFIQLCKILHLPVTGSCTLELTFDDSRNVISSGSAGSLITVTNLKMNCKMIPLTAEYIKECRIACERGEFLYLYERYRSNPVPWAQSLNTVVIPRGVRSANALLVRWYLSTDVNNINARFLQKSQYLPNLQALQIEHGSEFIPRQPLSKVPALFKATQECSGLLHDGDGSTLLNRNNFTCVDGNSTLDATPLFVVFLKLQNANRNTGRNLNESTMLFRTQADAVANLYCETFLYYSSVLQVSYNGMTRATF